MIKILLLLLIKKNYFAVTECLQSAGIQTIQGVVNKYTNSLHSRKYLIYALENNKGNFASSEYIDDIINELKKEYTIIDFSNPVLGARILNIINSENFFLDIDCFMKECKVSKDSIEKYKDSVTITNQAQLKRFLKYHVNHATIFIYIEKNENLFLYLFKTLIEIVFKKTFLLLVIILFLTLNETVIQPKIQEKIEFDNQLAMTVLKKDECLD